VATLQEIVAEVDRRADGRPIGKMQTFRTATKGLKRQNRNYPRGCVDFSTLGGSGRRSMALAPRREG